MWFHAVSLGEVKVATHVIASVKDLIPGCSTILSTTTEHGKNLANRAFGGNIPVIYGPIDHIFSVREALSRVRPDAMIFLETEIWPAWLFEARRMGVKTALVNGRLSVRSIRRYIKFRSFFRQVLKNVDSFSMRTELDGKRIRAMGADPEKIVINGNAKYDLSDRQTHPEMEREIRHILDIAPSRQVFIAGSTREGEDPMILDVYENILKHFPETILILAPRHIKRTPAIESLLKDRGLGYQLRTEIGDRSVKRTERVVIIDTFGELAKLYSVGTIIFCGGSLVPQGGQNPIEAAIWGKVVFYGPCMDDFLDAKAMLESVGAGVQVSSPEVFSQKAVWYMKHPEALESSGARARKVALSHKSAAEKHARVISRLFHK